VHIYTLGPIAPISIMRFSISRCHFLQCPLESGIGGSGWVHPKVANSMATFGHISKKNFFDFGSAISVPFGINGVRNKQSHPKLKAHFQLRQETELDICQLVGVVRVMYLLRMAKITSGSSFEPNNPTEQKLGYF